MRRVLLALALAATLFGCTAKRVVKAYPGPALAPDDVATVVTSSPGVFANEAHGVYIIAVDGVTVAEKAPIVEQIVGAVVRPGQHSITFGFNDGNSSSTSPATLVFEAEAGKTYELHAAETGSFGQKLLAALTTQGRWAGWLTERPTGRVVAGPGAR